MNRKELLKFLDQNEKEVRQAMKEFDEHSRRFDETMRKILGAL